MKIERVYRDAYGTTWMYASCERTPKRRRKHRRRKKSIFPLCYKAMLALAVVIIIGAILGHVNADGAIVDNETTLPSSVLINKTVKGEHMYQRLSTIDVVTPTEESDEESIETSHAEMEEVVDEVIDETPVEPTIEECIGLASFTIGSSSFTSLELPDVYYGDLDFSSFQPYEDYSVITNKRSAAYSITRSDRAYNDENGLRRYDVSDDQFSIDGKDDYVIALGTFYKPKGTCGQRYLIVTTNGYYTAIAGDEKSDEHTDDMHMFTLHCDGQVAGIIEWLVDTNTLNTSMKRSGNIATQKGPVEELKGDILYIYLIEE